MQKIPKIPAITAALLATTSMVSAQPKAEFPLARFTLAASVSEISETTTEHLTSVDINGDGFGDYDTPQAAEVATGNRGGGVVGGCGDCNGPNVAGTANPDPVATTDSNDGPDGGGKIVCTAMNAAYGFGSYRQAIWLAHAQQNMTQYHQTGYHLLALPLIRIAYGSNTRWSRIVRSTIEHMARERTADIRAEMRGSVRRPLGRMYRAVLEPLCYIKGWAAGGREVPEIKEVPVIAAAMNQQGV